MADLIPLFPRKPVPDLSVPLVNGTSWKLSVQKPKNFAMIVFYRGLHCPICKAYLHGLSGMLSDFASRGVDAIAISSDSEERGKQAHRDWQLGSLPVGYGLGLQDARQWGLYVSAGRGKTSADIEEPPTFSEPGLFLVKPDRTLYFSSVQTMPFARPAFAEVLKAVDYVLKTDYPARGEVTNISGER